MTRKWRPGDFAELATFVDRNEPNLDEILNAARRALGSGFGDKLAHSEDIKLASDEIASAAYDALRCETEIRYDYEPPNYGETEQIIRLAGEVKEQRVGTCLDLALLFGAVLELAHLKPAVIFLETESGWHALSGYFVGEGLGRPVIEDQDEIRRRLNDGLLVPIESGGIAVRRGEKRQFRAALDEGREAVQNYLPIAVLDVLAARDAGYLPVRSEYPKGEVLDYLAQQMKEWFDIVGYRFESHSVRERDYFQWIINVQNRRGFDRILVRGIDGMARGQHVVDLRQAVERQRADEGWLVAFRRVDQAARDEAEKQPGRNLFCYTFDELLDATADFTGYLKWLEQEIKDQHIDEWYVDLACTKEEFNPATKQKVGESRYDERNGWIDRYIGQWLADPAKEHISILGEFGMGKTWFTLHYAWVALQRYREAREQGIERPRLPLVIPLRDYARAGSVEVLFSDFFFRKHDIRLHKYSAFEQLNRMGKLLLIFDGFDEMASRKDRHKMNDHFRELQRVVVPGAKVILTTRSEFFPTTGEELALLAPQFEVLHLERFNDDQIRKVLSFRTVPATVERIMSDRELMELVQRPVMIEYILKALPDIDQGKPVDMSRVYLYAVQRVMERDIKAERTFTSQADKLYFLCELSWEMLSTNRTALNYRQFPDRLRRLFGNVVVEEKDIDHWQYDLLTNTMLIRTADGDYSPAHRSLLEFFAAYKFVAELGVLAPDFTELAKAQSYVDQALEPRDYSWSEYFHREVGVPPLRAFAIEDPDKLKSDAVDVESLSRNALAFAAQMVSTDPECLDRLCTTAWERPGVYGWNALNLLPFLKYQSSEALAKSFVARSEEGPLRSGVAWVLGELGVGADEVLEALRRTVRWFAKGEDVTPSAWWESAFALEKLSSEFSPPTGRRGDGAIEFLVNNLPPGYGSPDIAIERFVRDLKSTDPSSINQSNIVGILAFEPEVNRQELFRAIKEHVDFSADRMRRRCYYSVWLCGHLRIEESLDDIVKATKHDFGSVRNCATEALGKMGIGSDPVVSALEDRLQDRYYRARYHAAWALGELKSAASLAKLDAAIKDEEVPDVRQEMIRVRELQRELS